LSVKGASPQIGQIAPHLVVDDIDEAVSYYQRALGAVALYRTKQPDGVATHVHLRIGRSIVLVTDEGAARAGSSLDAYWKIRSPRSLGGTTTILQIYVDDARAVYDRAVGAGAQPTWPLFDAFWGDRYGLITDPFGHVWAIAEPVQELSPDEITANMESLMNESRRTP
jgi:PhnB protein